MFLACYYTEFLELVINEDYENSNQIIDFVEDIQNESGVSYISSEDCKDIDNLCRFLRKYGELVPGTKLPNGADFYQLSIIL